MVTEELKPHVNNFAQGKLEHDPGIFLENVLE